MKKRERQVDGGRRRSANASARDNSNLHRFNDPKFWKPGDPLTEEDERLLDPIREKYRELGYSPSRNDLSDVQPIRQRFRIWSHALMAAGLPAYNDPDETRRRMAIMEARKRERGEKNSRQT